MFLSRRRVLIWSLLAPALLLALIWFDVLPGGWRLRGWVTPHAVREARRQAEHSERRLVSFAAENAAAGPGATVWLGSSTIERFPLDELLGGGPHLNRGIGSESAPELLERVERSLPAARPARLVFYIGSIDFRIHGRSAARIATAAEQVIEAALGRYGEEAKTIEICVLGILPEREMPAEMVSRLEATNAALAALCGERWRFLDLNRTPIRLESGSLNPELAADRLHLNHEGYEVLAKWLIAEGWVER